MPQINERDRTWARGLSGVCVGGGSFLVGVGVGGGGGGLVG